MTIKVTTEFRSAIFRDANDYYIDEDGRLWVAKGDEVVGTYNTHEWQSVAKENA